MPPSISTAWAPSPAASHPFSPTALAVDVNLAAFLAELSAQSALVPPQGFASSVEGIEAAKQVDELASVAAGETDSPRQGTIPASAGTPAYPIIDTWSDPASGLIVVSAAPSFPFETPSFSEARALSHPDGHNEMPSALRGLTDGVAHENVPLAASSTSPTSHSRRSSSSECAGRARLGRGAVRALSGVDEDAADSANVSAVERKRQQNTMSARRCRARKERRVKELEAENDALRRQVKQMQAVLSAAGLMSSSTGNEAV